MAFATGWILSLIVAFIFGIIISPIAGFIAMAIGVALLIFILLRRNDSQIL